MGEQEIRRAELRRRPPMVEGNSQEAPKTMRWLGKEQGTNRMAAKNNQAECRT